MSPTDTVTSLSQLISHLEGYGTPGLSITNGNNPGAMEYGSYAQSAGATGVSSNGTAIFPDEETGFQALQGKISQLLSQGYTTPASLVSAYTGTSTPNAANPNLTNYQQYVASGLGINPNDPIPTSGTASQPSSSSGTPSWLSSAMSALGLSGNPSQPSTGIWSWLSDPTRIVTVVLGLGILIIGIFFLRPVQQGITEVVSTAKKGAALVA